MTSSRLHIEPNVSRRFRRLTLNTVITLYCLIIAGGVVRSTGAGMGCPDWPKCFGSWIPPTHVSQLAPNYKDIYGAKLKGEVVFNPVKTWTEYINRLLGAFTGIMIFGVLLASIPYLSVGNKRIFLYSLLAFLLVGIQGALGARVVSTELMPLLVTLHMLLAIVIVFVVLYLFVWAKFSGAGISKLSGRASALTLIVLLVSLVQILLGTQVREEMDEVIKAIGYQNRNSWIDQLGVRFYIHRSFSILLAVVNLFWFYSIAKNLAAADVVMKVAAWCLAIVLLEIVTGVLMAYFGVPAYAQPVHLTLAIGLIGLQFVVWLLGSGAKYLDEVRFASFDN
jgi:heme a synthase